MELIFLIDKLFCCTQVILCQHFSFECLKYRYFVCQFEGQEISLDLRVGIFITMNPGYAGRTELPESVKALFRPVVVIVPDLQQICEIMLFSEGFLMAKVGYVNMNDFQPRNPSLHPARCLEH